ncbi:DUF892 family protein [Dyadobacter sp. CY345]|uniref:DUF892 family protein n=1 Tax=Dyadobacter sp. CY345 TaxID=2909335 RepID=UPI001F3F31D5|nr:DUF892 family protein [Dyadobacter sp. CY345]MCF2446715.1 DUF892 family protein [Dyadobacter sp. CY345]
MRRIIPKTKQAVMINSQPKTNVKKNALNRVLMQGLKDGLATEHTLITILPGYARVSVSAELTSTFDLYATQLEEHIDKLRLAFKSLGERPAQGSTIIRKIIIEVIASREEVLSIDMKLIRVARCIINFQIMEYSTLEKIARLNDSTYVSSLLSFIVKQEIERQKVLGRLEAEFQNRMQNDKAGQTVG